MSKDQDPLADPAGMAGDAELYRLNRPPYTIPTVARLRVCARIEPELELVGQAKFERSLAERWDVLTERLPLFGSQAMRGEGVPALERITVAMPWAEAVISGIEREIRIQLALGRPWVRFQPLLLVGPPGIGKSWIAARLGAALGLGSAMLQLGNMSDDRMLSGTARGWTNAQPAWPLVMIASTRSANPLLVLDELDKAGGSARAGRPHHALLSMIESSTASRFYDQCLLATCDLSQVNWIACANTTHTIPRPLLSRFQVVELPPPAPEHFEAALGSIAAEAAAAWNLPIAMLPDLPEPAIRLLKRRFARDRAIRKLARDARSLWGAVLADGRRERVH